MTTKPTRLTAIARIISGAIAALLFTAPAIAQSAGERGFADSGFWRPMLDQCYRGGNNYDAACAQHEVLKRGMANRFGEACYLGLKTSNSAVSKLWLNKYLQKIRQCQDYALSYDEALRQCISKGEPSCQRLAGGGGVAGGTQPIIGGVVGGIVGGGNAPPPQTGAPSIGGILNSVEDAAGTLNTLKGLFQ